MRKLFIGLTLAGTALVAGVTLIGAGCVDVAADSPHSPWLHSFIAWARDSAIARQTREISPPADLSDEARIKRGAGNYAAMCAGCHLVPGGPNSEIRQGLYPQPPNFTYAQAQGNPALADARRFWVIKHGIKASGMPAWGLGGMSDRDIWDLTVFLKVLPNLSATQYHQLVAASDGHVHEGMEHGHDHGEGHDH
jgi:mono/diheme cytochrome c family protein